jgi:hypothetical protein
VEDLEARLVLSLPVPDHVVIVIEENQSYSDIIGSSDAPYINSLAGSGAVFTQSYAIDHPSEPNYLDLFSGSDQGTSGDNPCPIGPFHTPNLGGELIAAGLSFAGYFDGMPSVGYTGCFGGSWYTRLDNPLTDFSDVPSNVNKPFAGYFPTNFTSLPQVSWVIPSLIHDMHDGTIAQGDTWLRSNLQAYINWSYQHNSLFILTFDEDDFGGDNQIPTIFVGPMVQPGQYSETINHYSVLRTLEDMYGLPYAGHSADVNPITDVWAGAPTHFAVTASAANPDVAGTPFTVTVTAQDANGNTVTGYRGTVHFTGTDPQAVLPGNYTFTAADAGMHTFTVTLKKAGNQTITATDTLTSSITGNVVVTVNPAAASWFFVTTDAGSPAVAGTVFDVGVTALDPYFNVDTNYRGRVHFSSGDPYGASRPADYTFQASDQGAVIFFGVTALHTAGTWDVTATDTVNGSITGSAFVTVIAAPAVSLQIVAPPSATSGTPFDVTVIATDPYGNTDTNYGGTVTWTTTDGDPGVVLPATYAFRPSDQGMVTFPGGVTLITPGGQMLTATDTASGITGNATVTVTAGPLTGPGNFGNFAARLVAFGAGDVALAPPAPHAPAGTADDSSRLESVSAGRFFSGIVGDGDALVNSSQGVPNGMVLPNELALSFPGLYEAGVGNEEVVRFPLDPLSVDRLLAD